MRFVLIFLSWCMTAQIASAQAYCPDVPLQNIEGKLIIGTKFAPPFVMGPKNQPEGLNIALWRLIADCLKLGPERYSFSEFGTHAELVDAVRSGAVSLGIADMPITVETEARIDFSVPFFQSSLGVLVPDRDRGANFALLLRRIFHSNVLIVVAGLFGFMIAVALAYWWVERRNGSDFFAEGPLGGIYRALIWAALLIFQGEGDPFELKSRWGQVFVLLLMFLGVTIISSFTAIITSSLTLQGLEPEIETVDDLDGKTIGVISQSKADIWAANEGVTTRPLQTFSQAQRYFEEGEIDALLHEQEVLRYMLNRRNLSALKFSELTVAPQSYAIAFAQGSSLREPVNLALLTIISDPVWNTTQQQYFSSK